MKKLAFILIVGFLVSCGNKTSETTVNSDNRSEILNLSFSNSDVQSIEIVEIEHPMLGGIILTKKLNDSQKEKFLTDFDNLKVKGMLKCGAKYVIQLNMGLDTLRLKVCGNKVALRSNDLYYELENGENIIEEYLEIE